MDGIEAKKGDFKNFKEKAAIVFKKHPEIMIVYLYGSTVQKKTHKFSDIDIGLVLSPNTETDALYTIEIQNELKEILGLITNRLIDVRILNGTSPSFLNQAVRQGIQIYCLNQDFKDEFELYVLHTYFDFKPYLEMFENNYLNMNLGENIE